MFVRFNPETELRKYLSGKKTNVPAAVLLFVVGPRYLEMLKSR